MAPFKSKELKSDWRSDFLTEETDCDCEGCGQDPCIKCGESHHSINERMAVGGTPARERLGQITRDAVSKNKVGGLVDRVLQSTNKTYKKARDADKAISANAKNQNWKHSKRSGGAVETDAIETSGKDRGKITRVKIANAKKSPAKKTTSYAMSSESHDAYEEVQGGVSVETYTKDTKFTEIETVDIIKTEPLKSTSITEEVLVEDFMTNLYNEGYSVDEINEYLLEEYEIEEEYLEEVWGILAKGALKGAKLLSKGAGYAAKRTVKDSGKVAKFVKNPKNWSRANKDTQKVIDTVAKGAKDTKELAARTYAAGQKTRKIVDAGSKNLLGPAKSFKKLTSDFKKSQQAATRAINIEKIRATKDVTPVISKVKAPTNIGKVELPKINWKATTPKGGTATATQKATTSVKQITSSQPNKGLNAKFSKEKIRHRGMQELDRTQKANKSDIVKKELERKISRAYDKNLEKTGDKIIKDIKATPIPKNKAIVKSPSGSLAKSTDKGSALTKVTNKGSSLTKTAPDKGSTLTKVSDKGSTLTKTQSTALSKTDDKGSALAKRKDNVKRAVAATSFATGSLGGVEVSKKLGLINKKEKNESFSDWRSEINL